MFFERLISAVSWVLAGSFTVGWLGIMLSAAALATPIVGMAQTIGAFMVVYAVKCSVQGRRTARVPSRPIRRGHSLILR